MPALGKYLIVAVAFILISLLFVIAMIQNLVDEDRLIATPNIPRENAVLSAFASIKIKGSADEVFGVIKSYKGYPEWSPFHDYKWKDVTVDGVPRVGSPGSFMVDFSLQTVLELQMLKSLQLTVEDFPERTIPVRLTLLDRESRRTAEKSTDFPKWLLASERVQEVVPIEGQPGFCEYRTYQTFEGLAAYYLLLAHREEFEDSQQKCAIELKAFVEQGPRRGDVRIERVHSSTMLGRISHIIATETHVILERTLHS